MPSPVSASFPWPEDRMYMSKRRRQTLIFRTIALAFLLAFCYAVTKQTFAAPTSDVAGHAEHAQGQHDGLDDTLEGHKAHTPPVEPPARRPGGVPLPFKQQKADKERKPVKAQEPVEAEKPVKAQKPVEELKPLKPQPEVKEPVKAQAVPAPVPVPVLAPAPAQEDVKPPKPVSGVAVHSAADAARIERGLQHIIATTPDEIHVRELMRPIDGTGKERLRETGLRARAYRIMFEPWEDLHLVTDSSGTHVRDDIIGYLRKAPEASLAQISSTMTRAEIIRSYETYRYFLTQMATLLFPWTAPYFSDHMTLHAHLRFGERGIVLSGGDDQLQFMMTGAKAIRALGCALPIEVMYLGDDDLGEDSRAELEALPNVVTRDMRQMVADKGWDLKGWAGKPFAVLLSSFREVIFIDADAMFFQNPEVLFADPTYEETGALFFRDRLMFPESKKKWLQQVLPKPISKQVRKSRFWTGESGHMQESGVVVVDKWRHFMALLMVTRMNGPDRDGDKDNGIIGTYDMMYGDKETFWIGWELVGDLDYGFHPGDAGIMGVAHDFNPFDKERKEKQRKEEEREQEELEEMKSQKKHGKAAKEQAELEEHRLQDPLGGMEEEKQEAKPMGTDGDVSGNEKEQDKPPVSTDGEKQDEHKEEEDLQQARETQEERKKDDKDEMDKAEAPQGLRRRDLDDDLLGTNSVLQGDATIVPSPVMGDNYTICAPQLLHLGRDGAPLWFNGWILQNKFDKDKSPQQLSTFDSYMSEIRQDTDAIGEWRLEENNVCCLQSDVVRKFTAKEREVLRMIVKMARSVGAVK